jgi:hypothetical protein
MDRRAILGRLIWWEQRHRMAVVYVICLLVYWIMLRRRSLRKQETHSISNLGSKRRRATIESFDTVGDDNESIETHELCS